jgi:hypothetical protein
VAPPSWVAPPELTVLPLPPASPLPPEPTLLPPAPELPAALVVPPVEDVPRDGALQFMRTGSTTMAAKASFDFITPAPWVYRNTSAICNLSERKRRVDQD